MLHDWLAVHESLQAAFHPASERVPGTEGWRKYVEYNLLAAVKELMEFMDEVEVRPWIRPTGVVIDKARATMEIVDVLHFVANLALACDITDEQLEVAYRYKLAENYRRLSTGRANRTDV